MLPGFLILAAASSVSMMYGGMSFVAFGSATVVPSLTALASLYTTPATQGAAMGRLRSVGAFARAFGPTLATLLYWRYGSRACYVAGAALTMPTLMLLQDLPSTRKRE